VGDAEVPQHLSQQARDGTTIRPIDVAAILTDLLPDRWFVYALWLTLRCFFRLFRLSSRPSRKFYQSVVLTNASRRSLTLRQ
jgi:hypothetical protein